MLHDAYVNCRDNGGASDSGGGFGVDSLPMHTADVPKIKVNGNDIISSEVTNYFNYFIQTLIIKLETTVLQQRAAKTIKELRVGL